MSDTLRRLIQERANLVSENRALLDVAEARLGNASTEDRANYDVLGLAAEERATYNARDSRVDAIDAEVEIQERSIEREKRTSATAARYGADAVRAPGGDDFSAQVRSFLKTPGSEPIVLNPVGTVDGFRSFMGDRESRALSSGTSTAGGVTIPTVYQTLIEHMVETSNIFKYIDTLITAGGEPLTWPRTSSFGAAESEKAEASTLAGTDPSFNATKLTLSAYKFAQLIDIPRELLDDSLVNLQDFVLRAVGINLGLAISARIVNGSGSSQSRGIILDSTLGVTGATTGVAGLFTADEIIDLEYSVIEPYANRPGAAFLARRATVGKMRKLKDTTNNYLWQPSLQVGAPNTFDGYPVLSDLNVPAVATSAKSVLFGDLGNYLWRQVGAIRFERDDSVGFKSDMVSFKAVVRGDGGLKDLTGANKYYAGAAS